MITFFAGLGTIIGGFVALVLIGAALYWLWEHGIIQLIFCFLLAAAFAIGVGKTIYDIGEKVLSL